MLRRLVENREAAVAAFGTPADFKRYGADFRQYIRQARVYDDASMHVRGSSRGLLQYYAVLQLAKAELLVHRPASVFNTRVGHGLSFSPERARSFLGDRLTVQNDGVFRELFELRTGDVLPIGTTVGVADLLRACPDVGFEVGQAGLGETRSGHLEHFVVWDDTQCWSVLLLIDRGDFVSSAASMKQLRKSYSQVELGSSRLPRLGQPGWVFESNWTVPAAGGSVTGAELEEVGNRVTDDLAPFLGMPMYGLATLAPSQLKSRLLPMPPDLARYAVTFYVSSVVRYKPSRLVGDDPPAGWMLDAFTEEACVHLLRSALAGITGTVLSTNSPESLQLR